MVDLHVHTRLSYDCEEDAENYVLSAERCGARIFGFSEHYDYDAVSDNAEVKLCDLSAHSESVAALNGRYPGLKILKGIELGYRAEALPHYGSVLRENFFDYAILSVHTLKGRGDCYFPRFFAGLSKREAYYAYFKAVLESVRADLDFQTVGHMGYVARNAPFDERKIIYAEFTEIIDEILKEIISRGLSLEINTSVGNSGMTFIPDTDILDRYSELGGKNFTFGSDAHSAKSFMRNADGVKKYLSSRGVKELCYYENKALKRVKI